MQTIKINAGNTRLIAHRGCSALETENTAAAFIAAGNRGYFGIETDVQTTADGAFVLLHDAATGRVAKENLTVAKSSLAQLRRLRLNENGTPTAHLVIPTLEEYLRICQRYDKTCVLELKSRFTAQQLEQLLRTIERTGYLPRVIFISFHLDSLIELRRALPKQPLQYLVSAFTIPAMEALQKYRLDLDIAFLQVDGALVQKVHKAGLQINCWTCDDREKAEALIAMGVDYITTNRLEPA